MYYMRNLFILGSLLIFSASCGEDSSPSVTLPTNLVVSVTQSEEDSAQVVVSATAERVNFFRFDFGDGSDYVQQTSGDISYTYDAAGTYTLTVTAHVTTADFISDSTEILIPEEALSYPDGYITPESYDGMALVWSDEFEGESLKTADWTFETGNGTSGWGNNELEYYQSDNTSVADGYLVIEAREESKGGYAYTSSRIITQSKQTFQYGRVDIRAVLPEGQGIWPALWMLGTDVNSVSWPACGEIDIMEMIGGSGRENTIYGTIHWSNAGAAASYGNSSSLSGETFADAFHVFSILWDEESIKWYVDDVLFNEADITPDELSEFQESFFFIFNVAVGGNWPGSPDSSTTFPQRMVVDYIRVFQVE